MRMGVIGWLIMRGMLIRPRVDPATDEWWAGKGVPPSNYAMGMAETQNRALFPSQTISGKAAPERALGFGWGLTDWWGCFVLYDAIPQSTVELESEKNGREADSRGSERTPSFYLYLYLSRALLTTSSKGSNINWSGFTNEESSCFHIRKVSIGLMRLMRSYWCWCHFWAFIKLIE